MGLLRALFGRKRREVPIYVGHEAPLNQDYRCADDEEHIIRIDQQWPDGINHYLHSNVHVAGISQRAYQRNAVAFIEGTDRVVMLARDPENRHDANAITVLAYWLDESGRQRAGQVGWVPADTAREIAEKEPFTLLGARLKVMFVPRRGKSAGLRIHIGGPKKRKQRKR